MKKSLKIIGSLLGILLFIGVLTGTLMNEALPEGKSGPEADALAHKMLKALHYEKFNGTRFLHWSFRKGKNQYQWDKKLGICRVTWDNNDISLNLVYPELSTFKNTASLSEEEKSELIRNAVNRFNNDSFWLVAPYKVFDHGTQRSVVELEDGAQGLLVTYSSGGSTPGDSYLWLLNDDGFPKAFKMWVEILPIGGIKASWDDWLVTESGAFLPKTHKLGPLTLEMGQVKGFN